MRTLLAIRNWQNRRYHEARQGICEGTSVSTKSRRDLSIQRGSFRCQQQTGRCNVYRRGQFTEGRMYLQWRPTSPVDTTPSLLNPTSHTLVRCPHPVQRSLDLRSTLSHPLVDSHAESPILTLWFLLVVASQLPSQPAESKEGLPSRSSPTSQTLTVRSSEADAMRFPSSRQDTLPRVFRGNDQEKTKHA